MSRLDNMDCQGKLKCHIRLVNLDPNQAKWHKKKSQTCIFPELMMEDVVERAGQPRQRKMNRVNSSFVMCN